MTDVLTREQRSYNMSRVRGRDTKLELVVRHGLHSRGLRFRLHCGGLPGRPDLVFPKYRAVVFLHGCFWHGHDCPTFRWPRTRTKFWREKIRGNQRRDRAAAVSLRDRGWRVLTIWECALKGRQRRSLDDVLTLSEEFVRRTEPDEMTISGTR